MRRSLLLLVTSLFLLVDRPVSADLRNASCPASAPVLITRVLGEQRVEEAKLRLTDCFGQPRDKALVELSLLARPHGVPRPARLDTNAQVMADSVRKLDPRLLTRLQALATRWPGKRIEVVSGYRPNAKGTSRHHHGRALDLRVVGVDKEEVVAFAKTIPGTGVGYYPNSVFTHIDVREEATTWIDHSAPGERARYGKFPENFEALLRDAEASKDAARAALYDLQTGSLGQPGSTARNGSRSLSAGRDETDQRSTPNAAGHISEGTTDEGPSPIGEGLDTTSALIAVPADVTSASKGPVATSNLRPKSGDSISRRLTQELGTIETGSNIAIDDTQPQEAPATASRIESEPIPSEGAPQQTAVASQSHAQSQPKAIDWSPPW